MENNEMQKHKNINTGTGLQSKKVRAMEIFNLLNELIENPVTELEFNSPFECYIAVVLSAQCTDKRVNIVTKELFKKYNTPYHFADLKYEELEKMIYSTGFYRNKSKSIIDASKIMVEKYNGQLPTDYDELLQLPGVGRKTANVLVSNLYDEPAIAVDTHVFRVSRRLGFSSGKNVVQTEKDLQKLFPPETWTRLHNLLVLYGRYYCKAKQPICHTTPLAKYCNHDN